MTLLFLLIHKLLWVKGSKGSKGSRKKSNSQLMLRARNEEGEEWGRETAVKRQVNVSCIV